MANYIKKPLNMFIKNSSKLTELELLFENIPPLSESGPWIAGECMLRMVMELDINNENTIDIYVKNMNQFQHYRDEIIKSKKVKFLNSENLPNTLWKGNVSFMNKIYHLSILPQIHLSVVDILDSFDLNICQIGFDGTSVTFEARLSSSITSKSMYLNKVSTPESFMENSMKYSKLGFNLPPSEISKFFKIVKNQSENVYG
jgi:hypothetical protein